jgi:hypothetical protein
MNFSEVSYLTMLLVSRPYSVDDRMINEYKAVAGKRMKLETVDEMRMKL